MVVTRTRASKTYARSAEIQLLPRLIEVQLQSFKLFQNELLLSTKMSGLPKML